MEKRALVLGGSGFVGRHVSRRLSDAGWRVTVGSRGKTSLPPEVSDLEHVVVDRTADSAIASALGAGVDVLVDVIPCEIADANQLVSLKDLVGSLIANQKGQYRGRSSAARGASCNCYPALRDLWARRYSVSGVVLHQEGTRPTAPCSPRR
jgi:NAD(P)-dependent dehydrogenase (short-subunit alcohol dehydrogenase family)